MRHVAHVLLSIVFLLVNVSAPRAQQDCAGTHCDALVARLMISGEDCGSQTWDPSQTVEYSQLVTGARDFDRFPIATLYPIYSFAQRMNGFFEQDDPGFFITPNPCAVQPMLAPIPPGQGLYVDFLTETPTAGGPARNLLYWDGVDDDGNGLDANDVDWSPVLPGEFLRIREQQPSPLPDATASADGGTSEVAGLLIEPTGASGNIHDHIDFELRQSASGQLASFGVYLLKLDLTMPRFAEGAPIHVIFSTVSTPAGIESVARTQVENELVLPLCSDGVDNDRDGLVDFPEDYGCDGPNDDSEKTPLLECDDGIDNDGDGFIDHRADPFGAAGLWNERDPDCLSGAYTELPEPSTTLMLAVGAGAVSLLGRRRFGLSGRRA